MRRGNWAPLSTPSPPVAGTRSRTGTYAGTYSGAADMADLPKGSLREGRFQSSGEWQWTPAAWSEVSIALTLAMSAATSAFALLSSTAVVFALLMSTVFNAFWSASSAVSEAKFAATCPMKVSR